MLVHLVPMRADGDNVSAWGQSTQEQKKEGRLLCPRGERDDRAAAGRRVGVRGRGK